MPGIPVYDIECLNWTYPVAVGLYDGTTYHEFIRQSEEDDPVWRFLLYIQENLKGIKLYAHNAARYDSKFLLAKFQEKKEPVRLEAGLFRLTWLKPRITFEDSSAVLPGKLRDLSEGFGLLHKLDWAHDETDYPWIMAPEALYDFRAYLKRDCLSLSEVMGKYAELLITKLDVVPSLTLALTSVKAFDKGFYQIKKIESNEDFEKPIRAASYGGRNEIYKMYGENLNFYDIRQAYVACYDVPVPIGKMLWTSPNIDRGSLAFARVKIPKELYIGPLPFRLRGESVRSLMFPVGEIAGWWDMVDLRYAVKERGCDYTIVKQLEADEAPILKEFADRMFELRNGAPTEIESRIWKLFGSRLVGKLGQSRWQSRIKATESIEDFTGSIPVDELEEYHEFTEYIHGDRAPYIKPALNMRIRAEARVRHARLLEEALKTGSLYYCDTDSVVTDVDLPIGEGLGDLKLVTKALKGYFIQCKFYGYIRRRTSAGGIIYDLLHQVSSGFRDFKLSEEDFEKLLRGELETEGTVMSFTNWKDILKKAEVKRLYKTRTAKSAMSFRNRRRIDQNTFPLEMQKVGEEYRLVT